MSAKLLRLEAILDNLERAAGLRQDLEVVQQNADGSWPAIQTTAPLVIERKHFRQRDPDLVALEAGHAKLHQEALRLVADQQRLHESEIGQYLKIQHDRAMPPVSQ